VGLEPRHRQRAHVADTGDRLVRWRQRAGSPRLPHQSRGERDQQAQLAVAAERGRITRELHDAVAHGLSLIVIQGQGGRAALNQQHPEQTRQALDTIVTTGRQSLAELRLIRAGSE
jgi:signal transduction histidine kinase